MGGPSSDVSLLAARRVAPHVLGRNWFCTTIGAVYQQKLNASTSAASAKGSEIL